METWEIIASFAGVAATIAVALGGLAFKLHKWHKDERQVLEVVLRRKIAEHVKDLKAVDREIRDELHELRGTLGELYIKRNDFTEFAAEMRTQISDISRTLHQLVGENKARKDK